GCPETDHSGKRRDEEAEELAAVVEFARSAQHRPETARLPRDPPQQQKPYPEHEGRADPFQEFDGFDPAPDHRDIERPERKEADPYASGKLAGAGPHDFQHRVDRLSADPRLNPEPPAGYERPQYGRNVRPANPE